MSLVHCDSISKTFGAQAVLEDVTFQVEPGEKVGCIGPNGGGKSTLIRILTGDVEPDDGTVTRRKSVRIGYLPQVPDLVSGNDVRSEALRAFEECFVLDRKLRELEAAMAAPADDDALAKLVAEHGRVQERFEQAGGYAFEHRVDAALMGLGFSRADLAKPVSALSGGEKNRLALAKLLVSEPELLVLDEPTNFLDLPTTTWLEEFLRSTPQAVLVVSHDRYFLDRVVTRILEVKRTRLTSYRGDYTAYLKQLAERRLTHERSLKNQQAYIAKEEAFIRKHMAGQRTKEAQGRRTRLARLERIQAPEIERTLTLRFGDPGRSAYVALEARNLRKAFGKRMLFRDLSLRLDRGMRLGIIGPNGAGKTTLLRVLRGTVEADGGTVDWGHAVEPAWYDQEQADLKLTVDGLANVRTVRPDLPDETLRTLLGALGLSGDAAFKSVGALSGGERSRVALACVILQRGNFLVLDEPTNHLDIASRGAIETALDRYDGTMVIVSHDRYLLDQLATHMLVLGPETPRISHGNYTDHVRRKAEARNAGSGAPSTKTRPAKSSTGDAPPAPKRRSLDNIERDIMQAEAEIEQLHADLADSSNWRLGDKMRSLQERLEQRQAELQGFEAEWEAHAAGR